MPKHDSHIDKKVLIDGENMSVIRDHIVIGGLTPSLFNILNFTSENNGFKF